MDSRNSRRGGRIEWRPPLLNGLNPLDPTLNSLSRDPSFSSSSSHIFGGWSTLPREESALETQIILLINSGDWASLNPNSGQSVQIGKHHVCVGYREDPQTGYRTWEWHGHLLKYDGKGEYTTDYFYGNYPQPMLRKDDGRLPTNVANRGRDQRRAA